MYLVTVCSHQRLPRLADGMVAALLIDEWHAARDRHGWLIGRYVIMPDHVHFFAAADASPTPLSRFVARWKEWTAKRAHTELRLSPPLWQARFQDHLLRSDESSSLKWDYVRNNPVRAGLVTRAEDWPFQGRIDFE